MGWIQNFIYGLRGGRGSNPGLVMWDLWWTKWRWGRFSPRISVSPADLHSTDFSTITITYHPGLVQQASSGRSTQSPTAQIKKKYLWPFRNEDLLSMNMVENPTSSITCDGALSQRNLTKSVKPFMHIQISKFIIIIIRMG
jgi:hypothetical protein